MLSRKFLAGLGLTEAQVEAIVEGNEDSIKGLKAQIDEHKTKEAELNEKIAGLQKEVEDAKASALEKEGKDPWKLKYDTLNEQFTAYKAEEEKKATKQKKLKEEHPYIPGRRSFLYPRDTKPGQKPGELSDEEFDNIEI